MSNRIQRHTQRLSARLYAAVVLLGLLSPSSAWACCHRDHGLDPSYRPSCQAEQLVNHMCFNPNMDQAVSFMGSPVYQQTFNQVVGSALSYLNTIEPAKEKVVLFDLDETLVDNRAYFLKHRTFDQASWDQWVANEGIGRVNAPVLNLLQTAKAKGFSVMFVTGRPVSIAEPTLRQVSLAEWNGAFLKPTGIHISSADFKAKMRQSLRDMGYTIVLNIGDQTSDFDLPVSQSEGEFLLPNVMYTIP